MLGMSDESTLLLSGGVLKNFAQRAVIENG
jgi:hypothetical protein